MSYEEPLDEALVRAPDVSVFDRLIQEEDEDAEIARLRENTGLTHQEASQIVREQREDRRMKTRIRELDEQVRRLKI